MLVVEDLTYDYPGRRALDGVRFELEQASVTALIGPNGAGKSTLMRIIAGLERPLRGRVLLQGEDVHKNVRKIHEWIGFLPDIFGLYNDLTVAQCLRYRARAQNLPPERIESAVTTVVEKVGLKERLREKAGHLSRGLKQRLAIAQAIIHQPRLLLLDEPASGLDPVARAELSQLIKELNSQGMTILVSSHILSELEDYSTSMLALEEGKILAHEILLMGNPDLQTEIVIELAEIQPGWEEKLQSYPHISRLEGAALNWRLNMTGTNEDQARLLHDLVIAGFSISSFSPGKRGLQEAYLQKLRIEKRES